MAANIKLEFRLKPKQRQFVEAATPWSGFIGGVGSGKTHTGAIKSIMAMIEEPGSLGLICAPTYTMLRDASQRKFFELLPRELIKSFNKNEQHLIAVNDSEVLFRSLDQPDKIRGMNIAWFWDDEGPLGGFYAWQMLKQRAGRQDPKRFRKRGWVTGTPKGRDGFWREFVKNKTADHTLIQSSTLENLSNLPENYVEGMNFTGAFYEQEIMGSFEAFEGLVYHFNIDPEAPDSHIRVAPNGKRFDQVIGGVDWGYTNPSVALVLGIDSDSRVWHLAEFYQRGKQLERDIIPAILDFTREYGVSDWYCDPAEPEHIAKLKGALDSAMLPCEAWQADNTITTGIQTVQTFLTTRGDGLPGLLIDPSCVYTITEFGSYQYEKSPDLALDEFVKEKPVKQNDHAMDALRYALHTHLGGILGGAALSFSQSSHDQRLLREIADLERAREDENERTIWRKGNMANSLRFLGRQ